jgi:hypothetical protein
VVNPNDPQISVNDFRVAATDSKGHSERSQFRMQPGMLAQMSRAVDGRMFPYRNNADLVRHAIMRHLGWLETLAPIPSVLAQLKVVDRLFAEAEFQQDFDATFVELNKLAANYQAAGQPEEARKLVLQVQDQLRQMPPGAWRDRYLNEVRQRFAFLIDGQAVNMGKMTDGPTEG